MSQREHPRPDPSPSRSRTIFLTWELGGGLGHVTQLFSLANGLLTGRPPHRCGAPRVARAAGLLDNSGITFLQSPYRPPASQNSVATPRTFAHVLWNAGFADPSELRVLTEAWGNLLDFVAPDLIVFDHAPTALLAARATSEAGRAGQRLLLPAGLLAAAGLATVDARGVRVVAKGGAACIGVDEPGP